MAVTFQLAAPPALIVGLAIIPVTRLPDHIVAGYLAAIGIIGLFGL